MAKEPVNIVSVKLFGITFSATLGIIAWIVLRWPNGGLFSATGPMLAASGAMIEPTRERRTAALVRNIALAGVMEFFRAMASNQKLLVLPVVFIFGIAIHRLVKAPASAAAIAAAGLVNTKFVPYLEAFQVMIAFVIVGTVSAWAYFCVDFWVLRKNDFVNLPYPPKLVWGDILRRVTVFTAGYYLSQALDWRESNWIVMTSGLSYVSGYTGKRIVYVAFLRYTAALPGILLGILFLSSLSYMDYHYSYLSYLIGIIAFYVNLRNKSYWVFYFFFAAMLMSASNLVAGSSPVFGNAYSYFVHSTIAISIGASMVVLMEMGRERPQEISA